MKFWGVLAGLATFCAVSSASEEADYVVDLTTSTYKKFIEDSPAALVEFYAPWCGHCKALAPEYKEAARILKEKGSVVPLAKVDATAESELAKENEVRGYPTLFFYRNGKREAYGGGRKAQAIVDWIERATGPAVEKVKDESTAEALVKELDVAFVGAFTAETSPAFKNFATVADEQRQLGKFVAFFGAKEDTVYVYRVNEDRVSTTTVDEAAKIEKFLASESFPLLGAINGENFSKYAQRADSWVWFCGEKEEYEKFGAPMRRVSKNYRAEYNFVWLNTKEFKSHAENGLGLSTFPGIAIQTPEGRYLFNGEISEKTVTKFIDAVRAGKVEKHFKSEPIPETNDESVKVVVGKNFESLVLQEEKDVFLEIYAPWCGHCKKLEPTYKEFADSVKDSKNIIIAKMDGTANEVPISGFEFQGFPTLFYVPAGEKKPIAFDGERTLEGLRDFVQKTSKYPLPERKDEL